MIPYFWFLSIFLFYCDDFYFVSFFLCSPPSFCCVLVLLLLSDVKLTLCADAMLCGVVQGWLDGVAG